MPFFQASITWNCGKIFICKQNQIYHDLIFTSNLSTNFIFISLILIFISLILIPGPTNFHQFLYLKLHTEILLRELSMPESIWTQLKTLPLQLVLRTTNQTKVFFAFFFNSLHARLSSHYKAWSYKKKNHKKIRAHRKSVQKEHTVKRCLLILDFKAPRS